MADTYRCINAFTFKDRMYPGGLQVEDGDDILATHGAHFARVTDTSAPITETATAEPGEQRDLTPPRKAPAKKAPAKKTAPSTPGSTDDEDGDA